MSMIIIPELNFAHPFSSYLQLQEAIQPRETEYGTDGHNEQWQAYKEFPNVKHTFFTHVYDGSRGGKAKTLHVSVSKDGNSYGFGTKEGGEFSSKSEDYNDEPKSYNDAHRVFGKVLHVILHSAEKTKDPEIHFSGVSDNLRHTYDGFVRNKHILNKMKEHGYSYHGKNEKEEHVFKRDQ